MDITVPDKCIFYRIRASKKEYNEDIYCFAHAVLRALEGEEIRTKLVDNWYAGCDDCLAFGPPQSHELGGLRRDTRTT